MIWVRFMDMHSGGGTKVEPFDKILIEAASEEEGREVFAVAAASPLLTPAAYHEWLVTLACDAYDAEHTVSNDSGAARERYVGHVRERMAQAAQAVAGLLDEAQR